MGGRGCGRFYADIAVMFLGFVVTWAGVTVVWQDRARERGCACMGAREELSNGDRTELNQIAQPIVGKRRSYTQLSE